jgi:hypothetical protein
LTDIYEDCYGLWITESTKRCNFYLLHAAMPVAVAARSKAWVCGRSPSEIVGSNPVGGMDVCCECWVLSEVPATSRSLVQRSSTDCGAALCVI